ncbi:hypothetical protein LCGC14_0541820 [marine sediment metagenome]|uniref:Uncharacterized protein n=1 Tax=marine sediment metagenome TaxID=412755 RepID=A0A0F9RSN8_9ZZZZ
MLQMVLEYVWLILGVSYHYLVLLLPYLLVYTGVTLFGLPGFFIGRYYERLQWRREIKSGKRLGELIQFQLKNRDEKIKTLTEETVELKKEAEEMKDKHRRMIGLAKEMI